jgi:hypothetical protein
MGPIAHKFFIVLDCIIQGLPVSFLERASKTRFVSGHDFSRADGAEENQGFSPCGMQLLLGHL